MTLALAIWGTVTGTIAVVLEVLRYLADRVALSVSDELGLGHDDVPSELVILVDNLGRRATTVTEAGWLIDAPADLINYVTEEPYMQHHVPAISVSVPAGGQIVSPRERRERFRLVFHALPDHVHVDFPLRPYVVDIDGRVWWGSRRAPTFRDLGVYGWPQNPRARAVEPLPEALPSAHKIRPRWHLWSRSPFRQAVPSKRLDALMQGIGTLDSASLSSLRSALGVGVWARRENRALASIRSMSGPAVKALDALHARRPAPRAPILLHRARPLPLRGPRPPPRRSDPQSERAEGET